MTAHHRDVVAVGASAGGVEALRAFVAGLPADLPATVLVVLHIPARGPSALPAILDRSGPLPARTAVDGEPLPPGTVLVSPPDHHLLLLDGVVRLSRGPRENGHRPAVDPLFRSVAAARRRRAIGLVLSGSRDDGSAGLRVIAEARGVAIVQDPADALHPSMPANALCSCPTARSVPAAELGAVVADLVAENISAENVPDQQRQPVKEAATVDAEISMSAMAPITAERLPGARPAGFGCPACHGALFEMPDAPPVRYRCRIGHAWSAESLLAEQAEELEGALGVALRALREKAALSDRLARHALDRGSRSLASRYRISGAEVERAADTLAQLIERLDADGADAPGAGESPRSTAADRGGGEA